MPGRLCLASRSRDGSTAFLMCKFTFSFPHCKGGGVKESEFWRVMKYPYLCIAALCRRKAGVAWLYCLTEVITFNRFTVSGFLSHIFSRDFLRNKLCRPVAVFVLMACGVQALSASDISDKEVQQVLGRLDRELSNREFYKKQREVGIDSIKQKRARHADFGREWLGHTLQIAVGYSSFDNDSALYYYTQGLEKAMKLEDDSIVNEFRIRRATYLSISGYINDAINDLSFASI